MGDVDAFFAQIRYELRSPINAILGYSQLLLEEGESSPLSVAERHDLEGVADAGKQLLHTIGAMLDPAAVTDGIEEYAFRLRYATRVPLTWEVDHPVPPPETATYETDPRIQEVYDTLAGVDLVLPGFKAMHPMGAQLPQECVRITSSDFKSMIFPTQYRVPSYADWLLHEADMRTAYRWHRMFLEHLQSRHPAARWVLKSPGHLWALDALTAEYPNALLVQTHRDPLRILASLSSLVAGSCETRLRPVSPMAQNPPTKASARRCRSTPSISPSARARASSTR
jgi:hypothetical protein